MKPVAIVDLLWEREVGVIDQFLDVFGPVTVLAPDPIREGLRAIAQARGVEVVRLEQFLPEGYNCVPAASVHVAALRAHLAKPDWSPPGVAATQRDSVRRIIEERVAADLPAAIQMLDCLACAQLQYDVLLLVTSEDVTGPYRAATEWARANGVPSLHLAHSIALVDPFTVHAHLVADRLAVYGQRGAEGYLDLGIDANRIDVTGNPAWDGYAQWVGRRAEVRADLVERYGLDASLPLVVFGTTWSGQLTALDPGNTHRTTLAAFVTACEELAAQGVMVNAVVKDRPSNQAFGRAVLDDAIESSGRARQRYTYTTEDTEAFAVGADVLVAVDSNYLVEAMLVGTPVVNLVGWSSAPIPPAFDELSGVVEADPDRLGESLRRLLGDPGFREARLAQSAARVSYYNLGGPDGLAASRVARLMARMARRPRPQVPPEPHRASFRGRVPQRAHRATRRFAGRLLRLARVRR